MNADATRTILATLAQWHEDHAEAMAGYPHVSERHRLVAVLLRVSADHSRCNRARDCDCSCHDRRR